MDRRRGHRPCGRFAAPRARGFLFDLGTDLPLGAIVAGKSTTFRIFVPRAEVVTLHACHDLADRDTASAFPLARRSDNHGAAGVWEVELDRNLHGWYYWYSVEGIERGRESWRRGATYSTPMPSRP